MPKEDAGRTQQFVDINSIKDGIVVLKNGGLRRIILVDGVNFDLKSDEEQTLITYGYQNFLNSLDFEIQINIHSRKLNIESYLQRLEERKNKEENELLRTQINEYIAFIRSFVGENAVMTKSFFIVVPYNPIAIPTAKSKVKTEETEAKIDPVRREQLNQRADQVVSGLRRIGLRAVALEDAELLELYYNFYNPSTTERHEIQPKSADAEKVIENIIAPNSIEVKAQYLKMESKVAKTMFVLNYPRYLASGWFSPIINMPSLLDISIFISPTDTGIALKNLRKKAAQIESQIIDSQEKGKVRDPMLETAFNDIETLRDALQQAREKLFNVAMYITIYGETEEELRKTENEIKSILDSKLVEAKPASFEQLNGFMSTIPLGTDKLQIHSPLNSQPLSSFFPFVSLELTSDKGILYGINRHNNTLIVFDRFSLENANTVIFAKSGAGKSYATKLEMVRSLMVGTDVLVIDPENEYLNLAEAMGGSVLKISLDSENHINPFDIPIIPEGEEPGEVLKTHIINLTGLIKLMLGKISAEEEAMLDRAITETYASRDIEPGKDFTGKEPPLLEDFKTVLEGMEGGHEMATRLYRFTEGSFAGFVNKPTNINVKNRLVVFSIRDLEEELRPIAMYVILNFVWNLVRAEFKKRIMIVDEAWLMMKYPDSATFLYGLVKRARKYYLGVSTITQDVEDFMNSPYGRPIITNSSIQLLLKQAPATVDITAKAFNLTETEKNYLLEAGVGQGLFIAGLKHAAIQIVPSYFEDKLITTNPEQLLEQKREMKE
ncbi:MAG: ATP-binding protein [Candidatus Colwellbacteria bacterium]|nr:ATP-binding protein [Candidatus Colwellbacteria bacterium]